MSVLHRPSTSQAFSSAAGTVQQQSHSKFVWTTTYLCVRWHRICVCAVCAMGVCRCMRVCGIIFVLHPTSRLSFLFCLLCLLHADDAAVSSVSKLCLKLSSSVLCCSHGATAVAQQVCVDHFYACVGIPYPCVCVMCVLWYVKHVACATINSTAVLLKANNTWFLLNTYYYFIRVIKQPMLYVSSNYARCVRLLPACPFSPCVTPGIHVTHIPKGETCTRYPIVTLLTK